MAKKAQARRQGGKGTPAWAWLLVGLFVGALGYFGYQQYRALTAPAADAVPVPGTDDGKGKQADAAVEPPASGVDDGVLDTDYSFYDVLPSQDTVGVPVEAEDGAAAAAPATAATATAEAPAAPVKAPEAAAKPAAEAARYLLQAGAFERNADADDLKARIALSGEAARVESAEVNGKTVYRVRLGPYNDAAAAERARANLAGQGISAVSIKTE